MDLALVLSALLLGLSGAPHCIAMCGATSAAAVHGGGGRSIVAFHAARALSYALAGAIAAASVGALAAAGQWVAALRPLWTLVHVAALGLGLWLLWQGRQPAWLERLGRGATAGVTHRGEGGWQRLKGPARSGAIGLSWVAWPCGLLQSALLVAALANTAWGGALVMAAFAGASSVGLLVGPALLVRLSASGQAWLTSAMAVRLSGAILALASTWALGHGLWMRVAAWCFS